MPPKDEIAEMLIDWHFQVEPEISEVYRFIAPNENDPREPIKLLEVSEATLQAGRVIPFTFGRTAEVPYLSTIATITPEEMQQIIDQQIALPDGWNLQTAMHYPAPAMA